MKHAAKRRGVSTRAFVALLAVVLVIGCVAGGTVAWLTAKTNDVVNTFTYGDIDITLTETTGESYKIIPGKNISKNPKVTVTDDSEDCYLFVKVQEENWPAFKNEDGTKKVSYEIADGWMELTGVTGDYNRVVTAADTTREFAVLKDNQITVSGELTKTEITGAAAPKLIFTAYAVQMDGSNTAAEAWAKVDA